jgi:TonB family protein
VLGLVGAALLGGSAGWLYFVGHRGPASPTADEATAAQARVRELEARITQLEREKSDAVTKAAEEARATLEAQAKAGGRAVDPAVVARAQQEARDRAGREQERKQQEELDRLAAERSVEVQRLASEATPVPVTTPATEATPTPTPLPVSPAATLPPAPTTETAPASAPSVVSQEVPASPTPAAAPTATPTPTSGLPAVADPKDPGVKPPVLVSEDQVPYPSRAISRRISASVVVRALVDPQGRVMDVAIVQPSGQPAELGFDDAALKRVKSRRYRPARRHDVPVGMWVIVRIDFRPPRY